jgi:hypothetical protein
MSISTKEILPTFSASVSFFASAEIGTQLVEDFGSLA